MSDLQELIESVENTPFTAPDGSISGYVITADKWRSIRAGLRSILATDGLREAIEGLRDEWAQVVAESEARYRGTFDETGDLMERVLIRNHIVLIRNHIKALDDVLAAPTPPDENPATTENGDRA